MRTLIYSGSISKMKRDFNLPPKSKPANVFDVVTEELMKQHHYQISLEIIQYGNFFKIYAT